MGIRRNAEKLARAKARLQQVDAAITAILGGAQSYRIGSRSLTKADLAELRAMEKELEDFVYGPSGRVRRVVPIS